VKQIRVVNFYKEAFIIKIKSYTKNPEVKLIQVRDYSKNICLLYITNMVYEYPQYAVLIILYVIIQYLKTQYMRIITQIHVNMTKSINNQLLKY
jgi:hypothetical protein